jgi:hypothetical protein
VVPIATSGARSSKMIKGATLKTYPGAPHGLMATHQKQFNADLLAFARQQAQSTGPARRGGSEAPASRAARGA